MDAEIVIGVISIVIKSVTQLREDSSILNHIHRITRSPSGFGQTPWSTMHGPGHHVLMYSGSKAVYLEEKKQNEEIANYTM